MIGRLILAALAGSILQFLLGWLVYGFLLAFIFQRWAKFDTVVKGLTGGMIFGFLIALSYDIYFYASMNLMTVRAGIVDILANTVIMGLIGALIAGIMGCRSKAVQAP
jgi:hypothetical protein